ENLSGHSMDDVKVHYNSSRPAQLQAHAYAQGNQIHLAPGQEKHLAHEAWHVVQQKQGRVKPTMQLKSQVNINDDAGLEKEADAMGEKAKSADTRSYQLKQNNVDYLVAQRMNIDKVPWQKIEFRQLKERQAGQSGWTNDSIDDLLEWSKSFNQFRSVLLNSTHLEFQKIKSQFINGEPLPNKIKDINTKLSKTNKLWLNASRSDRDQYNLPDLDLLASYLLAILYSSEHIEFKPDIDFTPEQVKAAKAADSGLSRNNNEARSTLRNRELARRVASMKLAHGADKNIVPVKGDASDIGYYCVATGVHKDTLYVAFNYKKTRFISSKGMKMERELAESNLISASALSNIRKGTADFLKGHKKLGHLHIQFLRAEPKPPKPKDEAHAPAHAEMQLLKVLQGALKTVGVSKPCCKHCTTGLQSKKVQFHSSHDRSVSNWIPQKDFNVENYHAIYANRKIITLHYNLNSLRVKKVRDKFKRKLNSLYPNVVLYFGVAYGKLNLTIDTSKFASASAEDGFMQLMDQTRW
ncbi:MAG: DUF4157 domain-containing protein, partial [Cytophagia bacterium]|nr:DUF4157 domain-containing protein [Cytophagia bacterium]